jgi:hypothetical protein
MLGELPRHVHCLKHSCVVWCWIDCHMHHWVNEVDDESKEGLTCNCRFVSQCEIAVAQRLRGGRDATGTQPSADAVLLSGRGFVVVKRVTASTGIAWSDDTVLKAKAVCCVVRASRAAADAWGVVSRCRNSVGASVVWRYVMPKHRTRDCTPSNFQCSVFV